jgi:hypothetical protein
MNFNGKTFVIIGHLRIRIWEKWIFNRNRNLLLIQSVLTCSHSLVPRIAQMVLDLFYDINGHMEQQLSPQCESVIHLNTPASLSKW